MCACVIQKHLLRSGLFELEDKTLETCFLHSDRLQQLRAHVEAIELIRQLISVSGVKFVSSLLSVAHWNLISVCISDVAHLAPGYLQLAAHKYKVEIGDHFERLNLVSASQLQQLLEDPHVASILPRVKTCKKISRPQTRAQTAASSNVPGDFTSQRTQ